MPRSPAGRAPARCRWSARLNTGVGYRFRDQQAWVDAVLATARPVLTDEHIDKLRSQGVSMSTDEALAYACRGQR